MNELSDRAEEFLSYCKYYAYKKRRDIPLSDRTLQRYLRGMKHASRLLGHNLHEITDNDQLHFIEAIRPSPQGTRRVTTQILQRYIYYGIEKGWFHCDNILIRYQDEIIGPHSPTTYREVSRSTVKELFKNLHTPTYRILLGFVYYLGLTNEELARIRVENIVEDGILLYREVQKKSQLLTMPEEFLQEVKEFAEGKTGKFFPWLDETNEFLRFRLEEKYRAALIEANTMIGVQFRDFRTTAIKHFYERSQDINLTREFAGTRANKKGWFYDLMTEDALAIADINETRKYYGKKYMETVG
jgi:integrase